MIISYAQSLAFDRAFGIMPTTEFLQFPEVLASREGTEGTQEAYSLNFTEELNGDYLAGT